MNPVLRAGQLGSDVVGSMKAVSQNFLLSCDEVFIAIVRGSHFALAM